MNTILVINNSSRHLQTSSTSTSTSVWSPGSTTTTSSTESSPSRRKKQSTQQQLETSATQTTPTRSESLPKGFRPVRLGQPPTSLDLNQLGPDNRLQPRQQSLPSSFQTPNHLQNINNNHILDAGPLSPSTISEISIETSTTPKQVQHPHGHQQTQHQQHPGHHVQSSLSPDPSSPQLKYWTLPRNISIGSSKDNREPDFYGPSSDADALFSVGGERRPDPSSSSFLKRIDSDEPPPPNARFLYETPSAKYFTLPVRTSHTSDQMRDTDSTEPQPQRPASAYSVPAPSKYPGIGPVTENGIPLALRSVSSTKSDITSFYFVINKRF